MRRKLPKARPPGLAPARFLAVRSVGLLASVRWPFRAWGHSSPLARSLALSGAAVIGAAGGLTGALIGMGIPEYEAKQYESKLRQGNVLLSVHVDDTEEAKLVRQIMTEEKAEDISTGSEAAVPTR